MKDYSENTKKEVLSMKLRDTKAVQSGIARLASEVVLEQKVDMLEDLIVQLSARVDFLEKNMAF